MILNAKKNITKRSLKMNRQYKAILKENKELSLNKDMLDAITWNGNQYVYVTYNEETDAFEIGKNIYKLNEFGNIQLPDNIVEKASLLNGSEFRVIYDMENELFTLKPISKSCTICNEELNTIMIKGENYICHTCLSNIIGLVDKNSAYLEVARQKLKEQKHKEI